MTRILRSEARKLLSVPSAWWLAAAGVAFALVTVLGGPAPSAEELRQPLNEQLFVLIGSFARMFFVLVGVRFVTDEYQHGTIIPTFTTTPSRGRVLAAKVAVVGSWTFAAGLLTGGAMIAAAVASSRVDTGVEGFGLQAAGVVLRSGAAAALWGAVGVAIGALVRNAVASAVGVLAWLLVLEDLVHDRLGSLGGYLPGQSGLALVLGISGRQALFGALVLAVEAGLAVVAAILVTRRLDVT